MLRLAAPQWLLLIPVFAVMAWTFPRLGLKQPLRAACLALLALFLAAPELRKKETGVDLWVLMDRSASAADVVEPRRQEIESLLEKSRGANDRLKFVDFAAAPVVREQAAAFEGGVNETRARLAAEYALALGNPKRNARLLMIGDGFSTEDIGGLAGKLREAGVSLDLRLLVSEVGDDVRITGLQAPRSVRVGEAFLIEANVAGGADGDVPYELSSDGKAAGSGVVSLKGGRGVIRVSGRSTEPGARKYEVRLLPKQDAREGNNMASCWIEVTGGPSVLLVTRYENDPLAGVLEAQGIHTEVVTDFSRLHAGFLSGPRAVVINNVPAHRVPGEFLKAMEFFVREQGGGLMMGGGKYSFGAGGYFESAIDPLLPVSMELRQEHRKLAVAMAIVMDRSGSMAAGAGPGVTKMDLANEGAARSIELLGPADAVTVFAVDSTPHTVVPLSQIGDDAAKISKVVRSVQSAGGGIFVYVGLEAAWNELQKSTAGQRHVILFADAADSEEPGDYKNLLETVTKEGATVSVIGMGSPTDVDAALLEDIANRGKGRVFFNTDPAQLPALFAQETVAVARSAFIDDPVPVVDAGGWMEMAGAPITWPATVDGYNLSYLKPEAAAASVTGDEYKAPLVAFWQRGAGRAAAVTFPLAGDFSQTVRAWPQLGDFEQTLLRWLLPSAPLPGMTLKATPEGSDLNIELFCNEEWMEKLTEQAPRLVIAEGSSGKGREVTWERIEPGKFSARVPLPPGQWVRGVVQAGEGKWTFGPVSAGVDPEWDFSTRRLEALKAASQESGGKELIDLREAWRAPLRSEYSPIGNWLLVLLLGCFLADVAWTRWRGIG